ncbi:MAG: hypothetical protein HFJ05_10160 [Eubacterium sp.]|nr:hypothetical protein [Eubacterium sp.]
MNKEKELQENKPTNTRLKMTIGILFLVVLSIVELYLMMNYSDKYLFLGLVGLAILCSVYWVTDLSFKMRREQESSYEKDFESLYKAQKVSYITIKQGFAKFEELLDELGEELSFPVDEVLQAQKAVGRVTIQKNKENIDAVVESNEKLIGRLQEFEQRFVEMGERIDAVSAAISMPLPEAAADRQEEIVNSLARMEGMLQGGTGNVTASSGSQEQILDALSEIEDMMRREFGREPIKDRQQEILDYLVRIEASMKDEISELEVHMESKIDEIPSVVQEEHKMSSEELDKILGETNTLMEEMEESADWNSMAGTAEPEVSEDSAVPNLTEMTGDVSIEEELAKILDETDIIKESEVSENLSMPETVEMPGVELSEEGTGISGTLTMPETLEIPGMELSDEGTGIPENLSMPETVEMPGVELSEEEIEISENLSMPETVEIPGVELSEEGTGISENLTMPETVEVPGAEIKLEQFATSDDALTLQEELEGLAGSEKVMTPEEVAALLGDTGESDEVVEEEKMPVPDLSDPGHVMTPEEIAALVANM